MLTLPHGLLQSGLIAGCLVLVATYALNCYTTILLFRCRSKLCDQNVETGSIDDLAEVLYGDPGRRIVGLLVLLDQVGVCSAEMLTAARLTQYSFTIFSNCKASFSLNAIIFGMGALCAPFMLLRRLKEVAPLAALSQACVLASVVASIVVSISHLSMFGAIQNWSCGKQGACLWLQPSGFVVYVVRPFPPPPSPPPSF